MKIENKNKNITVNKNKNYNHLLFKAIEPKRRNL